MPEKIAQIIIVDDEKSICEILGQFLRMKGYNVFLSSCAEDAIETIKANTIDLVLTDIKMPGMSGIDLLKWVHDYNRTLPVLITTGFPTLDTAIEGLKLGAFDYLTKPFHLDEIAEKIKRALVNKKLEEENVLFSKLVSLHEVTKVLASTHDLYDLNTKILDFSVRISRSDAGSLMLFDDKQRLKIVKTSAAPYDESYWEQESFRAAIGWSIQNEEPFFYDARSYKLLEALPSLPDMLQAYVIFPLRTPKGTLGALNLMRLRGNEVYSNADLEIINVLTSQTSIAIENVRLYQNIRDNYTKTIRAFAIAVEAKDLYTHGHSENVMKYTVVLGHHLGLSDMDLENVKYAGLLHDIGKIGISEQILNKPGRLTNQEFDEIKKHSEMGARILSDVPFMKTLVPLVLHHHEFFNGRGYPGGLAGDNIPFGARILTVADAYEAMTSDRPYRSSMSRETALDILIKEKGKQFDPVIVDAFIEIMKRDIPIT